MHRRRIPILAKQGSGEGSSEQSPTANLQAERMRNPKVKLLADRRGQIASVRWVGCWFKAGIGHKPLPRPQIACFFHHIWRFSCPREMQSGLHALDAA